MQGLSFPSYLTHDDITLIAGVESGGHIGISQIVGVECGAQVHMMLIAIYESGGHIDIVLISVASIRVRAKTEPLEGFHDANLQAKAKNWP